MADYFRDICSYSHRMALSLPELSEGLVEGPIIPRPGNPGLFYYEILGLYTSKPKHRSISLKKSIYDTV